MSGILDIKIIGDNVQVETEDTIYCVNGQLLVEWLDEEDDGVNYVYRVRSGEGSVKTVISCKRVDIGDMVRGECVVEIVGKVDTNELVVAFLERVTG